MQSQDTTPAVALYARVSTEDQAERQTIKAQLDFLRKYCELHALPVAGEYVDDGISGTVPLDERPEGRRLLDDAEAARFGVVLVYRLDRLGRSLKTLTAAHDALDGLAISIRSGTEPFDTSSPIGRFVFQLLGSIAELDRETIAERMMMGKRRVAAEGKYAGGRIPFGYDVDSDGRIVLSQRLLPGIDATESAMVGDIFHRIAGGTTLLNEAHRLNALGVAPLSRYGPNRRNGSPDRVTYTQTAVWTPALVWSLVTNPTYKGEAKLKAKQGVVACPYPALIKPALWDAVQTSLKKNRLQATRNAKQVFLLRRLIACGNCGGGFTGMSDKKRKDGTTPIRYRCNNQTPGNRPIPATRCNAKMIDGLWLENIVWQDCRTFILKPGESLADAQRQLRDRLSQVAGMEDRRRELLVQIGEKEAEKDRVLTLYRRGRVTIEQAESEMDEIAHETTTLREMLESLRAQEALANAQEAHLRDAVAMLLMLQEQLAEIEATGDLVRKRKIIDLLVSRITVHTEGSGRGRTATIAIRYHFGAPRESVVVSTSSSVSESNCVTVERVLSVA